MFAIASERLILRDFAPHDFEAFFETCNDQEFLRLYPERAATRGYWQEIFDRILSYAEAPERTKHQLAICLPGGQLIGTCGVRLEEPEDQQASFGCSIARPYWGRGYALEAARRLIGLGFSTLPIHRLYAETLGENTRARALAERLGMRLEGELRHHRFFRDRWWDTAIYAVLRDEWEQTIGITPAVEQPVGRPRNR